ncbi:MAG: hypothetical protein AB1585_17035 [Thermodesulfobacteriota bacterium]
MAEQSKSLDFFPPKESPDPVQRRTWLKRQFLLTADAVLKENSS